MSTMQHWTGQKVDNENLQNTVAGPWSRVVDGSLASNTGISYNNLQDAWDAAVAGDSIFIKSGTYAAGLTVTSGAGNQKNGITLFGESPGQQAPKFQTVLNIEGVTDLGLYNMLSNVAGGDGWQLEAIDRFNFSGLHALSCGGDGFQCTQLTDGFWSGSSSDLNTGRGFVFFDGMHRSTYDGLFATGNTGNGFGLIAVPASNAECNNNIFQGCGAQGNANGWDITLGTPASGAKGWSELTLMAPWAEGNTADGFKFTNIGVSNPSIAVIGPQAFNNGSVGFRASGAPTDWPEFQFIGRTLGNNTGGTYAGFPASVLSDNGEIVTTVNAATYTLQALETILHVTYPSTGACTITLPTVETESGRTVIIKDASGNASANNITIDTQASELIDGDATWLINGDYHWLKLYSNGTNWYVVS